MLGNFLSCSKGVKDPLKFKREGVISLKMPHWKRASSCLERRTSWIFSSWGISSRVTMGTKGNRSCGLRKGQSLCELQGASWDSSPFGARFQDLL